ncbi:MAG TPA: hypothetical protein VFL62_11135 [Bradyrhizobium sp.]|uniref:hypothetical protein n=1 Tax=Bradyrhizobium sp. TaxID=376 RepID=UPI002D7F43CA|nr:hypothetical protein [Bradyrhizobium sp.]HET7886771.1 hypothetical protein [Bradyrhizobium sp.]
MFWLSQRAGECEWRARAVYGLFRSARNANTPEIRGLRLLRSWLSPSQLAQFDAFGYFDVVGGESGKKYRIKFGICANILELTEEDIPKVGWCVVPDGCLVAGDVMLAQKIALETCECAALARANRLGAPARC